MKQESRSCTRLICTRTDVTARINLCQNAHVCARARARLLTFAEMDGHALRLEQAVVLRLGGALGRPGLSQRVRQGRRHRRRGRRGGGGRGGVDLGVDGRDGAGAGRNGRRHQLPAEAEQTAGDLVNVERGRFCVGAGAARERAEPVDGLPLGSSTS